MKNALESFKDRVSQSVLSRNLSCSSALLKKTTFPLEEFEISQLEKQGNRAFDWGSVRKSQTFTTCHNIWNNRFNGPCILGDCSGEIEIHGKKRPCGIFNSTLDEVLLEDHILVSEVGMLQNTLVHPSAVLLDIRLLSGIPQCAFGLCTSIPLGSEMGTRALRSHSEWTPDAVEAFLFSPKDQRDSINASVERTVGEIRSDYSVIGMGATICHSGILRGVFIAPGAQLEGVLALENVFFSSSESGPIKLGNGVICRDSILHGGVSLSDSAQVISSIVFDATEISQQALVKNSVIGPDCALAQGEVTSSFLGPFVAAHHQSLLISALWPNGKGNIGYGANVGSNHTGRLPDQEIFPGEGCFFGLGVSVKFPADFRDASYSMFASGIIMLPQKIGMPFSLIVAPSQSFDDLPTAYNEIHPAWVLMENTYLIRRNEKKFSERGKSVRFGKNPGIYRDEIARIVLHARNSLVSLSGKKNYTDKDLPELGKNILLEQNRKKAVDAYTWFLRYFALERLYFKLLEPESQNEGNAISDFCSALLESEVKMSDSRAAMRLFRDYLMQEESLVLSSLEKDYERGVRIQQDYQNAHPTPAEDKVYLALRECNAKRFERIANLTGED